MARNIPQWLTGQAGGVPNSAWALGWKVFSIPEEPRSHQLHSLISIKFGPVSSLVFSGHFCKTLGVPSILGRGALLLKACHLLQSWHEVSKMGQRVMLLWVRAKEVSWLWGPPEPRRSSSCLAKLSMTASPQSPAQAGPRPRGTTPGGGLVPWANIWHRLRAKVGVWTSLSARPPRRTSSPAW